VETVLEELAAGGAVSDARFAEAYVRERRSRGFGPRRIRAELRERGVPDALAEGCLDPENPGWDPVLAACHDKKYGPALPGSRAELARRARFLEYRGFSPSRVRRFLHSDD
jgi:regulatory protein